ncbi:MAG TPA: alanine--glyoxylate aminotransferase family protein [Thermodesulfobacteriota bacterium]|nr:alanine--glyoxylate aminotransferase family protein [Thermodesulfobacteriota bacterium]
MLKKPHLFTPGPTPVPTRTLLAMAHPVPHHRAPEFERVMAEVREGLKWLFQTREEVLVFASSGTGAMESAVANLLSPGDRALVIRAGNFGERWANICRAYGVETVHVDVEWGKAVRPAAVKAALDADPSIRVVYATASETSTGVKHPIRELAELVRGREQTVLVVDAISALGVFELPADAWGLDVVVAGSQKGLMLPPGLAFVSVSPKAWAFVERARLPRFYFDYRKEKKAIVANQTAWTPAVSLIVGLADALAQMRAEGLEAIFARHALFARATREAMVALGLELYAEVPSEAVTVVKGPAGLETGRLVKHLRNAYGVTIIGGQGQAVGKVFRIATLGWADPFDVLDVVAAVEMGLRDLGVPVELGRGVAVAQRILYEGLAAEAATARPPARAAAGAGGE